jgi:hypothetical protein
MRPVSGCMSAFAGSTAKSALIPGDYAVTIPGIRLNDPSRPSAHSRVPGCVQVAAMPVGAITERICPLGTRPAAMFAPRLLVSPDLVVRAGKRSLVSGVLGVCTPVGAVCGTFLVKLFTGYLLAMLLGPCAVGGFFILLFAVSRKDRRLAKAEKPGLVAPGIRSTFYINPRKNRTSPGLSPAVSCSCWLTRSWSPTRSATC